MVPLLRARAAAFALMRRAARSDARCAALVARFRARLNARLACLTALRATFNRALARLSRRFAARARDRALASELVDKCEAPEVFRVTTSSFYPRLVGRKPAEAELPITPG